VRTAGILSSLKAVGTSSDRWESAYCLTRRPVPSTSVQVFLGYLCTLASLKRSTELLAMLLHFGIFRTFFRCAASTIEVKQ